VTVNLISVATGEMRSVISSDTGGFDFPNLLVAGYTLTAELPGFKKYTRENVQVSANTVSDVLVRLEIGIVTESVIVTAGEERVSLSSSQLLGFSTKNVVNLPNPVPSGNPNNFAILAPGTTTMSGGVGGQGGSIGGNRPKNNNFVVDGVDNNDPSTTGTLTPVIADAVEEFTLLTNQFNAEYGHSTAGQFITTTKSGTNQLHGGGWWYNQNRHTNSLDNLSAGKTKPRYDWNRFGGQVGGPTPLNRLFFFTAYEYQNRTVAGTSSQITVPTAAGLATLQNLAGISGTGISPVNVDILAKHVPLAPAETTTKNVTDERTSTSVPISMGTLLPFTPNFDRTHLFMGNTDYQAGKHHLSGRYSVSHQSLIVSGTLPVPEFNSDGSLDTQRIVFSDVFVVGPRIVNEFRAGYNRNIESRPVNPPGPLATTDAFGNYNINDLTLFIGPSVNPQSRKFHIYQFSNNTSVNFGSHTAKFGVEVRNIIGSTYDFLPRARGEYTWSTLDRFVRDMYPEILSIRGVGIGSFAQNRTAYYGFGQDTWKINPRVTLEYGLRYEFTTTARDEDLQDLNQIADITSVRDEVYTPELTSNSSLLGTNIFNSLPAYHQQAILSRFGEQLLFRRPKADKNNFAPRLGVSWDPFGDGKTSVRAGVGIAHDVLYGNQPLALARPADAGREPRDQRLQLCANTELVSLCCSEQSTNFDQYPLRQYWFHRRRRVVESTHRHAHQPLRGPQCKCGLRAAEREESRNIHVESLGAAGAISRLALRISLHRKQERIPSRAGTAECAGACRSSARLYQFSGRVEHQLHRCADPGAIFLGCGHARSFSLRVSRGPIDAGSGRTIVVPRRVHQRGEAHVEGIADQHELYREQDDRHHRERLEHEPAEPAPTEGCLGCEIKQGALGTAPGAKVCGFLGLRAAGLSG
jgi:hypothetical protein